MSKFKDFPVLSDAANEKLIEDLLNWSLGNGLTMYPPDFKSHSVIHAPVTLFPTPFPKKEFNKAIEVQKLFNVLYVNAVKDKNWFSTILSDLANFDPEFTGKLWKTYLKALDIGTVQKLSLGLFRSDYMVDSKNGGTGDLKQIEFNTVSVSFGGLSSKVGELHKYLNATGDYQNNGGQYYQADEELSISESCQKLAEALSQGDYYYNGQIKGDTNTVILFVVQPNERNCFDQRLLEYALLKTHGIKSIRLTLEEIGLKTFTDKETKKLYIKETNAEISVVYYRSGYSPNDYPTQACWDSRLDLEISKAIKCPSLSTQLSGAKKIQQLLTVEKIVRNFLSDEQDVSKIMDTFVKIYPMDDSKEGSIGKKLAFEDPLNYVLKPQREGGGNNIYRESIPGFLENLSKEEWGGYILMELISPPKHNNRIIREGKVYQEDIISELGIFGTIIFNEETGQVFENNYAGWLLRSKFSTSNEGGVAAGFGCVDSVYLH